MQPVTSVTVRVTDVSVVKTIGMANSSIPVYESPLDVVQVYVAGPITSVSEIPVAVPRLTKAPEQVSIEFCPTVITGGFSPTTMS